MNPIRGRFYLRLTSNGNLTGEFSNHTGPRIFTESADRDFSASQPSPCPLGFDGTYQSSWMDPERVSSAILVIESRSNPGRIFNLTWTDAAPPKRLLFTGQAMIAEGILIGDYCSDPS